jgi:predicted MFS family arabinose efflux permease
VLLLYGVLFAIGNGMASLIPVGVLVTRAFPVRTGIANSVVMSGMSVGQLVVIAALAALLAALGWRSVYICLAIMYFVAAPFVFAAATALRGKNRAAGSVSAHAPTGLPVAGAMRLPRFWIILAVYAICGFQDFFVSTHIVAFAQDHGVGEALSGDLLALMGLTGLVGLVAAGLWSDRVGPIWPTVVSFAARLAVFALILVDRSPLSLALFALIYGMTFTVTAPLTVLFVRDSFGLAHLGALTGLITMVHQICGGLGAYMGAALFDATGSYSVAFWTMLFLSGLAVVLTLTLRAALFAPAFAEGPLPSRSAE